MNKFILADEYVTDTVGLVVYLEKRKLGATAKQIFDSAELGKTTIYIPGMAFAEVLYLSEKKRISVNLSDVFGLLQKFPNFKEFPLNSDVIKAADRINDIPELHDRIIAATGKLLNLELITTDPKIQQSAFVKTVW